jgi:2-polyprenyl-6-methoxyphenol hydroxylase-like FAD-dependent oxidoreductase
MPKPCQSKAALPVEGSAGMMLELLLARAGVSVLVPEKHTHLLRDFRGETLHPLTLEIIHELGLLERLLRLPHQENTADERPVRTSGIHVGGFQLPRPSVNVAYFSLNCRSLPWKRP